MARKKAPNAKTVAIRVSPDATNGKSHQIVADRRPSVPNAVSKAYGAPGHAKMPRKQGAKPDGTMLTVMKNMVEQDVLSDSEDSQDDNISEESESDKKFQRKSIKNDQHGRRETRSFEPRTQNREEYGDEIDEDASEAGSSIEVKIPDQSQTVSPFAAVAKKIKSMWRRPERNIQTSFMTEDKIASEARIARPRRGLARRLIEMKEKAVNVLTDYANSTFTRILLVAIKYFAGALVVLFIVQAIQSSLPDEISLPQYFTDFGERIASPVQPLLDRISTIIHQTPTQMPHELDLSQLKSLKDSTTAQFKHLKIRLDNIEATYNRLAQKAKAPPLPARKINLFASGSGLVIDPYLTSPTRARDVTNLYLVTKWYSRLRGLPDSIHQGPMAAFTPWEDMGDCWCTPDSGGSAQIAVKLPQSVVPKELVVEHVSKHTTLQAGSAPKDIELWAQIKDSKRRDAIVKGALQYGIHQNTLNQGGDHVESLDETWIRIGQWTYNIDGASHIQTFEVQIPLEDFEAPVDRLVFRALNNWGPVPYVCLYRLKLHGLVANSKSEQLRAIGY